jgi:AAA+ ATPase superfamily predicted ATPase
MFLNRTRELHSLNQQYAAGRAELYVLYGRRRVGKTELLRAFCADKLHVFFVADLGTEATALADFTRQIAAFAYGRPDAIGPFTSWDAAFQFLGERAASERLVVVLDEFTYLIRTNPALPSILQRLWDTHLRHTQLMLVLCGSYVGMMEQQVLSSRSPLYGRRTAQWRLQPLAFADAALFFPRLSPADRVRAYAVLGGMPAYLLQLDDGKSLLDNVEGRILSTATFLYEEPRFLLLQEVGDPQRYFAILQAIAAGRTRLNEIAQGSGVAVQSVPFYLGTLRGRKGTSPRSCRRQTWSRQTSSKARPVNASSSPSTRARTCPRCPRSSRDRLGKTKRNQKRK